MSKGADFTKCKIRLKKSLFIFKKILTNFKPAARFVLWVKFLQFIFIPFDFILFFAERLFVKLKPNPNVPVIFVVGLQRTGSTLVSQFIEQTFPFHPIGNFNTIFKRSSFILHKFFSRFYKKMPHNHNYQNFYGISPGIFTVGDSYELWDQWFGNNHYLAPGHISESQSTQLINYFSSLYSACNKPLLTKNNRNALLISYFNKLFRNAFFIIVKRDPVAVIRSTIKASEDFFGKGSNLLWGLYPNNHFETNHYENIIEAATAQYLELDKLLDEQIKKLNADSYIIIDYKEFCNHPSKTQFELIRCLKSKIEFDEDEITIIDEPFEISNRLNNNGLDKKIVEYLKKLQKPNK
ncbi:MAG: sulfotransferase [Bacteroidales bacterium]